jgi:tetratricopeptide (TPR) repeat protein
MGHTLTQSTCEVLAVVYRDRGRYDEAVTIGSEALEGRRRALGEEHPWTLDMMETLASCYAKQGRHDEAETLLREGLEISRRVLGEGDGRTNKLRYGLACDLALRGLRTEAVAILRQALDHGFAGRDVFRIVPMTDEPDLVSLHGDPGFEAIVQELERRNEEGNEAAVPAKNPRPF